MDQRQIGKVFNFEFLISSRSSPLKISVSVVGQASRLSSFKGQKGFRFQFFVVIPRFPFALLRGLRATQKLKIKNSKLKTPLLFPLGKAEERIKFLTMQKMQKVFVRLATVLLLVLAVYLAFAVARRLNHGVSQRFLDTASVVQQVQSLSDLVTVKYVMSKVVVLEDVKWYGESRVLLLAQGVVKAGMDLKRLQPGDVAISGKNISLRLPPVQITDAYLDDKASQIIDHTTGLLRAFDKDLEQTARQNAVADIARAARRAGILKEAEARAKLALEELFKQAGFETVTFR